MEHDWVLPYSQYGLKIPVVTKSNHPRFVVGTRFDYGFLKVAIEDGYNVSIRQ